MHTNSLTVVLVSYRNFLWIQANIRVVCKLNKNCYINFIIIDNDKQVRHLVNKFRLTLLTRVLSNQNIEISLYKKKGEYLASKGSIQHARALDESKYYIKSEETVVLDPDCFILFNNWIDSLANYMASYSVDVFGFPEAKSDINHIDDFDSMFYKYISPLPFFLFGRKSVIFNQTFLPSDGIPAGDTGFALSKSCLEGNYDFKIAKAFSTRVNTAEIDFMNNYSCTFYKFSEIIDGVIGVHFGRGSNPFGKNRQEMSMFLRLYKSIIEPITFRRKVIKLANRLSE
jgi:hypothetical protein